MSVSKEVVFRSEGVVKTQASDDEIRERDREFESIMEIFHEFQDALIGLEGFSHIFALSFLHKLKPEQVGPVKIKPQRVLRLGLNIEDLPPP